MPPTRSASSAGGRGHAGCSSIGARFWSRTIPTRDDDGAILARIMAAVVPVVAGISLEYYFSYVDPSRVTAAAPSCRTTSPRCSA